MEIKRNGITVSVSDQVLEQIVLAKLRDEHPEQPRGVSAFIPIIGTENTALGGIVAGVARGREGILNGRDYLLIVGPAHEKGLPWSAALDFAKAVRQHGFDDFVLPNRKEQALLFANVPELFEKEWYWSSEQFAGGSHLAWMQFFADGSQYGDLKDGDYRARAVRRALIS